jgi:hypothetical protein
MVSLVSLLVSGTATTAGKTLLGFATSLAVFALTDCVNLDIEVQLVKVVIKTRNPNMVNLPFCISGKISQER